VTLRRARTGIDAVKLRRRNSHQKISHRTAMGMKIDGGRFAANLDDAIALADLDGFRQARVRSAKAGLLAARRSGSPASSKPPVACQPSSRVQRSRRIARYRWLSVRSPMVKDTKRLSPRVAVRPVWELPIEYSVSTRATRICLPAVTAMAAARSMLWAAPPLVMAIEKLIEKGRLIAAHLLQAPADQVSFVDGRFVVQNTERAIAIPRTGRCREGSRNLPEGLTPGLDGSATNTTDLYTFPNGCHVAEVEIDPDTGVVAARSLPLVDDFGSLINPRVALGQVIGGVVQGIGPVACWSM